MSNSLPLSVLGIKVFERPHPLALPVDLCGRIIEAARPSMISGAICLAPKLNKPDEEAVLAALMGANSNGLNFEIDRWDYLVKRYVAGKAGWDSQHAHADLTSIAARKWKFSVTVQLSDPEMYSGGALVFRLPASASSSRTPDPLPVPRTQGTVIAWPGWYVHEVQPITSGERWSLVMGGHGPPLR